MYLLDPSDGARRRALIRDKANHWLAEAGDFFRKTGQHLANRTRGMAHDTRAMFQRDEVSDRQLNERIRSRVGHLGQSSTVNFVVMDGRVTVTGQCKPGDVDALLSTVQGTPGVASIVNLLEVNDTAAPSSTV
jgi:osmotically-inducible protein OsmY